ncbi:50S ribosomal protein L33 [candidate division WOR-3 bacterium]|nr:50S ribosomal protein L33 [candidate division WOR-3 bacterium]MCK4595434.1 50S ribosomal protein L33 [candidate division WOR-3 bacterium]
MRVLINLECSECGRKNYNTTKNKQKHPDKVSYKKYCPFCKKHTVHKETK